MSSSRARTVTVVASLVVGVVLGATPTFAQPSTEIFIGYSYFRADPGETDIQGGGTAALDSANLHGTEVSGTWYVNRNTGIEAAFGYHRGSINLTGVELPDVGLELTEADVKQYTFLVGPRFRFNSSASTQVFEVRALAGGSNLNFKVPVSVSTFKADEFGFALAVGASYTVRVAESISIRVIQPDLLLTTSGGTSAHLRISTGIVIHAN